MRTYISKINLCALSLGLILTSCSKDVDDPISEELTSVKLSASIGDPEFTRPQLAKEVPEVLRSRDILFDLDRAVEPTACMSTPFDAVIQESVSSNLDQLGLEWFDLYAEMNFLYTLTDESRQYFGDRGQYTWFVKRVKRNLERFWKMRKEVKVRGQHNATLNDFDKIVEILKFWYELEQEEAESFADFFVNFVNVESTFLVESPLVSFDGFAIALDGLFDQGDLIVIGDGLVELAAKAGVRTRVVWKGIMGHEWAHQIQFNNFDRWYPNGAADNVPEATRTTELEADYFTGYYLTHRRGGIYSWNKAKQFLELFYNIGDCSFASDGHHGTPQQRMEAARRGYELGKGNKICYRKCRGYRHGYGHRHGPYDIMEADFVHEEFLSELDEIVAGDPILLP